VKLEEIFPANSISSQERDLEVYARDASEFEGKCKLVVWPRSHEQVQRLAHYARRLSEPLTIRGGATSTFGGTIPKNSIVVDMSKMNKVLDIGPDYVVVQAGVVVDELNRVLAKKKKYFPVVPLEHKVCTIGGMVATNCLGLDTYYGKMEDWVIGMRVVDGTGKVLDLGKVPSTAFVGSEGIFGVMCAVKLKIINKPVYKTVSLFKFNTITAMMDKVMELEKKENVLAITYLDDRASAYAKLEEQMHLIVEYSDDSGLLKNKDEVVGVDDVKERMQHVLVNKRFSQKEDPVIPKADRAKFLHWLRKKGVPTYAHMKESIIHPCFKDYSKLPEEMYAIVERLKGKIIGEYPVGIKRRDQLPKKVEEKFIILKNQYDNMKIMNRGVLVD
tara:strand:- start:948 stop:2108 length:1161 start_codon:yes stop_codon:yes gene_type:complete